MVQNNSNIFHGAKILFEYVRDASHKSSTNAEEFLPKGLDFILCNTYLLFILFEIKIFY